MYWRHVNIYLFVDWFSFVWLLCRHIVRNMPIMRTRWIGVLAFVLALSSRSGLRLLIWHQLEQQQYGIFSGHRQMEILSALMAICAANSPVPGEFPTQRPVTRSFDIFFDLLLNKRLRNQSWCWWFETPASYLLSWCHKALHVTTGWYQDKHRVM